MYKLKEKEPDFQCCDGPLEGRKFVSGKVYEKIPPEETNRFEEITDGETQRHPSPGIFAGGNDSKTQRPKKAEVTDA
jgi:hypothetical protein